MIVKPCWVPFRKETSSYDFFCVCVCVFFSCVLGDIALLSLSLVQNRNVVYSCGKKTIALTLSFFFTSEVILGTSFTFKALACHGGFQCAQSVVILFFMTQHPCITKRES